MPWQRRRRAGSVIRRRMKQSAMLRGDRIAMQTFELMGSDADDVRLLRAPACGYSIALAGHPQTASHPEGRVTYDAVLTLGDLRVQHGFRIDDVKSPMAPQELAVAFVTAFRNNRAAQPEAARVLPLPVRPEWLLGGAE